VMDGWRSLVFPLARKRMFLSDPSLQYQSYSASNSRTMKDTNTTSRR
jgi:hypothetical protein